MKNKFLSSLLAIGLIIALLPATASAQDKEVIPFDSALCTLNPDCTATFHKEGCPLYIMSPDILNPEFEENNAPFVMPNGPHVNPLVINKAEDDLLHQEQTIMNNRMNTSFAKILTIAPNDCDFADIQGEKGIIKKAFQDRNVYVFTKIKELQQKIDSNTELVEKTTQNIFKSVRELKYAFLVEITEGEGVARGFNG